MKQYVLLFGLLLLAGCGRKAPDQDYVPSVRLSAVERATEGRTMQFPGRVKAAQEVSLAFKVGGNIARMAVKEGDFVEAGALLAALDARDYQLALDAARGEYEQVKGEAERVMKLFTEGAATANANDKARYGLQQITAKYEHAQDQLDNTQLRAPFSGYVQRCLFEAHETVGAGMPVVTIISASAPEVELFLPAAEFVRRETFATFHCSTTLYPGETFPLSLVSIAPKANANQLYSMRLQFLPCGKTLPTPGMSTMVTIGCQTTEEEQWTVPTGAILRKGEECTLFLWDEETGVVREEKVEVVRLLTNGNCVVVGATLFEGAKVVSAGVHALQDGMRVTPLAAVSESNIGGLL